MAGYRIIGSGRHLPGRPYTNHDLTRVMDTSDEWIRQRTGVVQRHFCPEGLGASDLALVAAQEALKSAGREPQDVDYVLFNTMTPDYTFPGSAPIVADKLGCGNVPALDLRTQCAAMLFAYQVADGLLRGGAARCVLILSAEAQAGFMPWQDWDILEEATDRRPSVEAWDRASRHRGYAVIFGDGAGALLLERCDDDAAGLLSIDLHSDGRYADQLHLGLGFRRRPFCSEKALAAEHQFPTMNGPEIFKHAVTKLPRSVHAACAQARVRLDEVDWFIAHQANWRINEAIRERLGVPADKMPSNIDRYGNTSSATIPILMDEMRRDGRLRPRQLVCLTALGAGIHWGSAIVRV
ncbi:MAG: ketoacyl-ACP synthase III [Polyangiaceae bacterium]|nr:ketoacyl-ACP synthase III [Polyangiaceae bacterium]